MRITCLGVHALLLGAFLVWRLCWWLIKQETNEAEYEVIVLSYRAWKRGLKKDLWGTWF